LNRTTAIDRALNFVLDERSKPARSSEGHRNLASAVGERVHSVAWRISPRYGIPRLVYDSRLGWAELERLASPRVAPRSRIGRLGFRVVAAAALSRPATAALDLPERRPSELARLITFDQPDRYRIALFLGNAANLGRTAALVFDDRGRAVAVAKLASNAASAERLRREEDVLRYLGACGLRDGVPRLITAATVGHRHVLMTTAGEGVVPSGRLGSTIGRWLEARISNDEIAAAESPLIRSLWRPDLEEHVRRLGLEDSRAFASAVLSPISVRRTLVHGDFVPWNLLLSPSGLYVFDWEYGEVQGLPLWDEMYFRLQVAIRSWKQHRLRGVIEETRSARRSAYGHAAPAFATGAIVSLALRYAAARMDTTAARLAALLPVGET
jgi:hypothetical protein